MNHEPKFIVLKILSEAEPNAISKEPVETLTVMATHFIKFIQPAKKMSEFEKTISIDLPVIGVSVIMLIDGSQLAVKHEMEELIALVGASRGEVLKHH
jgi:hypothetical protein